MIVLIVVNVNFDVANVGSRVGTLEGFGDARDRFVPNRLNGHTGGWRSVSNGNCSNDSWTSVL